MEYNINKNKQEEVQANLTSIPASESTCQKATNARATIIFGIVTQYVRFCFGNAQGLISTRSRIMTHIDADAATVILVVTGKFRRSAKGVFHRCGDGTNIAIGYVLRFAF